ncbi:MAG: homogentisate 1,2-dioxygenase [Myxococcales bacterium]|nr:homogentisate 1,2-dioxygenase [Myxococcales bacterium]
MDIPYVRGRVAAQAHVALPDGTVEEEYAREGFFGRYAHLYRRHAPVGWTRIEGPLRPRAYDLRELVTADDYLASRHLVLGNDDVRLRFATVSSPMPYYFRNADADELLFVHAGAGRLETDFGPLAYRDGQYLLIPRGTAHRLAPTSTTQLLIVEASSEIRFPDKGMLGQHALFDPAVIEVPSPEDSTLGPDPRGEWQVAIQRGGALTRVFYPHCPLDVVGWKGTLAPMRLDVRDIRPVMSERYHLPPSAHTTFVMRDAVVCSFLPRGLETGDPRALKVPFYHSNIDYDEVLFYHQGEFFSRAGIAPGMLTFHPQGIHHGPQGRAAERARDATRTEEIAIMLDTRHALHAGPGAAVVERPDYWQSWQER